MWGHRHEKGVEMETHCGCGIAGGIPNTTGTAAWQQEKLGMHGLLGALESGRQGGA